MNVAVLQQFLHSLVGPLRAANGDQFAKELEDVCRAMDVFRDRRLDSFGEFLNRCHDYEQNGHWPSSKPSVTGNLLDEPTPFHYCERLRVLLVREMATGALSEQVSKELKSLESALPIAALVKIAEQAGVGDPGNKKPLVMKQIVAQLTGQPLPATRNSPKKSIVAPDRIETLLRDLRTRVVAEPNAAHVELNGHDLPTLKALAQALGLKPAPKSKPAAVKVIYGHLVSANEPTPSATGSSSNIEQFAEIVRALKAKAEVPGAPDDEIESELLSLERVLDRESALALCAYLAVGRTAKTLEEAMYAIRRKVFEVKRAKESIAY